MFLMRLFLYAGINEDNQEEEEMADADDEDGQDQILWTTHRTFLLIQVRKDAAQRFQEAAQHHYVLWRQVSVTPFIS